MHKKSIVVIFVSVVVVVAAVGGGYYYWWTGTPQYSLLQMKDAIDRQDSVTALSYFNTDAIFNDFWTQIEAQINTEVAQESQSGGLGSLGAMIGEGLVENLKPQIEQRFVQSFDAGIMSAASSTTTSTSSVESVLQNKPVISVSGDTATVSFENGIAFTMTHISHSYWTVVAINGLLNASSFLPSASTAVVPTAAVQSNQAPETSQKYGVKTKLISLSGQVFSVYLTVGQPESYQSTDATIQPEAGNEFVTVQVKYDNESNGPITYSDSGFSLVDDQSNRYQPYVLGRDPQLGFTDSILNSGQLAQGYITFEVPVGTDISSLKVHYESSAGGGTSFDFSS